MVGLLTFLDPPRPDTKDTIERANQFGVEVKMITGDHLLIAKETARQLGMGTNIENAALLPKLEEDGKAPANLMDHFKYIEATSGFAQVFPEHKFLIVEALRRGGYKVCLPSPPSLTPSLPWMCKVLACVVSVGSVLSKHDTNSPSHPSLPPSPPSRRA